MYPDNAPSAAVARALGMVEQPISVDRFYPGESRHFIARRSSAGASAGAASVSSAGSS